MILASSTRVPLVRFELLVNTAGVPDSAGLSALAARLLLEGTNGKSADLLAEEAAALGGALTAQAGWDVSAVSVSSLSEVVDQTAALLADVVLRPRFAEEDLLRVRDSLLSAVARRRTDPDHVAGLVLGRTLFGDAHPYAASPFPTEGQLRRVTGTEIRRFHQTTFHPGNAVLLVSGDISEATVRAKLEPLLADWRPGPIAIPLPDPRPAAFPARPPIYLVDVPGLAHTRLRVGAVGLARRSPDYPRALVANQILGGAGKRLDVRLRAQTGWARTVRTDLGARRLAGPWVVEAEVAAEHTAPALSEILRALTALREAEVTDAELQIARNEILRAYPARFATSGAAVAQYGATTSAGLADAEVAAFPRKIAAVTAADVRRAAGKYLASDRLAIVVVGDRMRLEPALRRLGDIELRDANGERVTTPVAMARLAP